MKKKLIKVSTLILGLVALVSCSSSSLNDVDLQDVSLLVQKIVITEQREYNQSNNNIGTSKKEIFVKLRDKNNKAVELLGGKVSVEGQLCKYGKPELYITKKTYYLKNLTPQNGDADYTVKVELSNGNVYNTVVPVPAFLDSKVKINTTTHKITWPKSKITENMFMTINFEDKKGKIIKAYNSIESTAKKVAIGTGEFDYSEIATKFPEIAANTYVKLTVNLWRHLDGNIATGDFRKEIPYRIALNNTVTVLGNS